MPNVERLGFDENFLDVSEMVKQRIDSSNHEFKGHIYKGDCGEGSISLYLLCFLLRVMVNKYLILPIKRTLGVQ